MWGPRCHVAHAQPLTSRLFRPIKSLFIRRRRVESAKPTDAYLYDNARRRLRRLRDVWLLHLDRVAALNMQKKKKNKNTHKWQRRIFFLTKELTAGVGRRRARIQIGVSAPASSVPLGYKGPRLESKSQFVLVATCQLLLRRFGRAPFVKEMRGAGALEWVVGWVLCRSPRLHSQQSRFLLLPHGVKVRGTLGGLQWPSRAWAWRKSEKKKSRKRRPWMWEKVKRPTVAAVFHIDWIKIYIFLKCISADWTHGAEEITRSPCENRLILFIDPRSFTFYEKGFQISTQSHQRKTTLPPRGSRRV